MVGTTDDAVHVSEVMELSWLMRNVQHGLLLGRLGYVLKVISMGVLCLRNRNLY